VIVLVAIAAVVMLMMMMVLTMVMIVVMMMVVTTMCARDLLQILFIQFAHVFLLGLKGLIVLVIFVTAAKHGCFPFFCLCCRKIFFPTTYALFARSHNISLFCG
jgi:hypothetical protein